MCNARNTPNLGRRQFLGGMALAGAGIATTGIFASIGLTGCASGSASLNLTSNQKGATDTGEQFLLRFKNGPLLHFEGMHDDAAGLTIVGPRQALLLLMAGSSEKIKQAANVTGDMDLLDTLCGVFAELSTAGKFNIIEP